MEHARGISKIGVLDRPAEGSETDVALIAAVVLGVDEIERLIVNEKIKHDSNPVMTWCAANAVVYMDGSGYRKVNKAVSTGRVDGIVAAIMATGISTKIQETNCIDQGFVAL